MGFRDDYDTYPTQPDYDTAAYRGKQTLGLSTQGMDDLTADHIDRAAARYQHQLEDAERSYWAGHDTRIGG